ncbi:cobalt transporter [Thermosipho melanesiensis]|uniref:Cobalt transport protein n=2 Tax=Thermosipho melanesiensis TaxID=46541 RepID=A6LP20_THEM4|nr:energy-coupling factor transporter transmembrane protein EcfT [Thermosipho melanesiensis]ABR31671.1 cobalt transport protein [Thermosipho melanesiensis BI429]APT74698.1 cobalt transporter [Thermosipho melanesiensis]OOC35195.1 cobalt transporter [Thermosipho melanesiensis]OOC35405.1 cobalt transporter [Thermosipho melanesiensis]OOC36656.1 cobalt transporter [Thermosipho melanesiensis]
MRFAFGRYVPTSSIIHSLDPRVKTISSFVFVVSVLFVKGFMGYLFLFGIFLIIAFLSNIKLILYLKSVKNMWFLIVFASLIQFFISGFQMAMFISLRLIFVVLFASFLTYTTSPLLIARGLSELLRFFGVKKRYRDDFGMIMTISFRFIPILFDEIDRIIKAQIARGAKFDEKGLKYKIQGVVAIVVPLLVSSIRKAEEISIALQARKYGVFERNSYYTLKWKFKDTLFFVFSFLVLFLIVVFS